MISITKTKLLNYFIKCGFFINIFTQFITYFNNLLYASEIEDLFVLICI